MPKCAQGNTPCGKICLNPLKRTCRTNPDGSKIKKPAKQNKSDCLKNCDQIFDSRTEPSTNAFCKERCKAPDPNCREGITRKCGKVCRSITRPCKIDGTPGIPLEQWSAHNPASLKKAVALFTRVNAMPSLEGKYSRRLPTGARKRLMEEAHLALIQALGPDAPVRPDTVSSTRRGRL